MLEPFDDRTPPLVDAWHVVHPRTAHPPTFRIYEKKAPEDPELHCDFIFVGDELRSRVRDVRVELETQAADHQPVIVTLG
jgi:endonuclease/exonuclease/phosphatase family metal-dependent hydrolase